MEKGISSDASMGGSRVERSILSLVNIKVHVIKID